MFQSDRYVNDAIETVNLDLDQLNFLLQAR